MQVKPLRQVETRGPHLDSFISYSTQDEPQFRQLSRMRDGKHLFGIIDTHGRSALYRNDIPSVHESDCRLDHAYEYNGNIIGTRTTQDITWLYGEGGLRFPVKNGEHHLDLDNLVSPEGHKIGFDGRNITKHHHGDYSLFDQLLRQQGISVDTTGDSDQLQVHGQTILKAERLTAPTPLGNGVAIMEQDGYKLTTVVAQPKGTGWQVQKSQQYDWGECAVSPFVCAWNSWYVRLQNKIAWPRVPVDKEAYHKVT